MEKRLFWQMQYAVFMVLKEKKRLSERDFYVLTAPLREKIGEKPHENR